MEAVLIRFGHALSLMGKAFRAAGMAAIARQLNRSTGIVTVLAAILAIGRRYAIARWMSALFGFGHNFSDTTFRYIDGCAVKLFPCNARVPCYSITNPLRMA